MKKIIALLLCTVMLVCTFAGCAKIKQNAEDKGAEIPVYISTEIYSFDPAYAFTDEAGAKLLGLVYEGLFNLNEKGKPEKALCKSYTTGVNRDGDFYMEITLNDTKWSDGRSVSANDFVFAWKRILEPEFTSEAASMLFDIKNARDCKAGLVSIDDVGIAASESKVLEVVFEHEIDVDTFIQYLCSPALVPLREDKVGRLDDWGSYYATLVTNGPYYPKVFEPGSEMLVLERSIYYYRDIESESQKLDVYVRPYRLNVYFVDPETALEMYEAGEIVYDSELPISKRADYADAVTTQNTLCTASVALNTTRAPFDNADVRRALSLAIDRQALADSIGFATPAAGLIPEGVFNTTNGTSFRKEGGELISASANMEEAKKLVSAAGASGASFTIRTRNNQNDRAIAAYLKDVWEQLGFRVEVEALTYESYVEIDYNQYTDLFAKAYRESDFDVILIDAQSLAAVPFPSLSVFARNFSGTAMDLSVADDDIVTTDLPIRDAPETTSDESDSAAADPTAPTDTSAPSDDAETTAPETTEAVTTEPETTEPETTAPETTEAADTETAEPETTAAPETTKKSDSAERTFETKPHITGYDSEEYNALIEAAFAEKDPAKRAVILHQAEEMLLNDMPVIPLFVYTDAYVKDSSLKTVGTNFFPFRNFKMTTLTDYERFKETEESKSESDED